MPGDFDVEITQQRSEQLRESDGALPPSFLPPFAAS